MRFESIMWDHLPLLVRASSKESVEYILEALWRTRRTGLDAADRQIFREILQLPPNDSDLDPTINEIQKLFPAQVLPELQRLLTLLLQKFQKEWREDISKDQLHGGATSNMDERDVKSVLAKDTMEMMLKSMYHIRNQLSEH
ncbi:hypothetical protein OROMI_003753 [Orobanche minor]